MIETSIINPTLLAQLQQCTDLPTPPTVAAKIIELSGQPNTDLDTLASIVAMDPALSAKILSIANSSMYMRRVEANTIEHAVAMFGWDGTLNLALGFAVVGSVRGALTSGLDYDYFWLRSLAAATAARLLGEKIQCENYEALFLPGLLQDIGMLALDKSLPRLYHDLGDKQCDHQYLQKRERKATGSDHAAVGEWLLNNWGVPGKVARLVGLSHKPPLVERGERLHGTLASLYLSGYLADCLLCEDDRSVIEVASTRMRRVLNITTGEFIEILQSVTVQFQEMATIFELTVDNNSHSQRLTTFATSVLAEKGMRINE